MAQTSIITGTALATELRKLADAVEPLERVNGEFSKPWLFMSFAYGGAVSKSTFIELAKALPKPYTKKVDDKDMRLVYESDALSIQAVIERSQVCELVEAARPAVYRCEPLLSADEDAEITGTDALPGPVVADAVVAAVGERITLADIAANFAEGELTAEGAPAAPADVASPEQQQEIAEAFAPIEAAEVDETLPAGEPLEPLEPFTRDDWDGLLASETSADVKPIHTTTLQEAAEAEDAIDLEKVG